MTNLLVKSFVLPSIIWQDLVKHNLRYKIAVLQQPDMCIVHRIAALLLITVWWSLWKASVWAFISYSGIKCVGLGIFVRCTHKISVLDKMSQLRNPVLIVLPNTEYSLYCVRQLAFPVLVWILSFYIFSKLQQIQVTYFTTLQNLDKMPKPHGLLVSGCIHTAIHY